jgi:DNA-binding transcriptional LysR family regulator
MFKSQDLSPNVVEEADDVPVLLQLVRSGFGCTILDASFMPTLPPGIAALEIDDVTVTLDIVLAWREDNMSPLASRFVEVARASIAGPLSLAQVEDRHGQAPTASTRATTAVTPAQMCAPPRTAAPD